MAKEKLGYEAGVASFATVFVTSVFGVKFAPIIIPLLLKSVGSVFIKGALGSYGKDAVGSKIKKFLPHYFSYFSEDQAKFWSNAIAAGLIGVILLHSYESYKKDELDKNITKMLEDLMLELKEIEKKLKLLNKNKTADTTTLDKYHEKLMLDFQIRFEKWITLLPSDIIKAIALENINDEIEEMVQSKESNTMKQILEEHLYNKRINIPKTDKDILTEELVRSPKKPLPLFNKIQTIQETIKSTKELPKKNFQKKKLIKHFI